MNPRISRRQLPALASAALLGAAGVARAADTADLDHPPAAAKELEGRLLAPCCWKQTLDVHASPKADELRAEIRKRIRAGESPEAVEADIVKRYTPKILAIPHKGFLEPVGIAILSGAGVALVGLIVLGRRRLVARKEEPAPVAPPDPDSRAELQRELAELD